MTTALLRPYNVSVTKTRLLKCSGQEQETGERLKSNSLEYSQAK